LSQKWLSQKAITFGGLILGVPKSPSLLLLLLFIVLPLSSSFAVAFHCASLLLQLRFIVLPFSISSLGG
jgi:hypothetical protein